MGTLWGVALYWLLQDWSPLASGLLILAFGLVSVGVIALAEKQFPRHDSPKIVLDEVVGYLFSVWAIPFTWPHAALGFLLFRFYDILKPFPIRWVDRRCPGGWGVVLDDVLAGVFANLTLRAVLWAGGLL
jgi:phosphatidylglycerophosphatase A